MQQPLSLFWPTRPRVQRPLSFRAQSAFPKVPCSAYAFYVAMLIWPHFIVGGSFLSCGGGGVGRQGWPTLVQAWLTSFGLGVSIFEGTSLFGGFKGKPKGKPPFCWVPQKKTHLGTKDCFKPILPNGGKVLEHSEDFCAYMPRTPTTQSTLTRSSRAF